MRDLFTGDLTRREVIAYVKNLPRDSALSRAVNGDAAEWGVKEHLLGDVVDVLQVANWQRTGRKQNKPKPIARPS